jgi:hypothetical protein
MRLELERMAQEEAEMLEYYKVMGIEEPRPRRMVMSEQPAPIIVEQPPPNVPDERERMVEARRERQREFDLEIALREAKKLENERLERMSSEAADKEDSESEYEDEFIDDDDDDDVDVNLAVRLREEEVRDFGLPSFVNVSRVVTHSNLYLRSANSNICHRKQSV